jgi:demethoxyubiquinone hydroxylase (CLK1/Coq7/Cat5 family)
VERAVLEGMQAAERVAAHLDARLEYCAEKARELTSELAARSARTAALQHLLAAEKARGTQHALPQQQQQQVSAAAAAVAILYSSVWD